MTKKIRKTRPFAELRRERLANPDVAAEYLNATKRHSPENFLNALKTVAQARSMTSVAKETGLQRETLYRSLSDTGNPTLTTLESVLSVCGLEISVRVQGHGATSESFEGSQTKNSNFEISNDAMITEKCFDALITYTNNAHSINGSDSIETSSAASLLWMRSGGLEGNVNKEN